MVIPTLSHLTDENLTIRAPVLTVCCITQTFPSLVTLSAVRIARCRVFSPLWLSLVGKISLWFNTQKHRYLLMETRTMCHLGMQISHSTTLCQAELLPRYKVEYRFYGRKEVQLFQCLKRFLTTQEVCTLGLIMLLVLVLATEITELPCDWLVLRK